MAVSDVDAKYIEAGIYTDLGRLLNCRHWAKSLKLFARQPARSMLLGEARSKFRGRGMEFEEVRHYQPGDDVRNIDWRVSARTGGTYTKLFREERERPVHILVDQRSSMFFGSGTRFKSVVAAELAAALGWAALAGSDRIGGQIIGDRSESDTRARRTKQAVLRLVHDLNSYNHQLLLAAGSTKSLAAMIEECRRLVRPGTAVFIISDFHDFDQTTARALVLLARHTDISLMKVFDPLEEQLPAAGAVSISDGQERASINLSSGLRSGYQQGIEHRNQALLDAAVRARAVYMQINTQDEPRQALMKLYGK